MSCSNVYLQRLSRGCNTIIRDVIKDSAHNYMEDPVLATACEKEVHTRNTKARSDKC